MPKVYRLPEDLRQSLARPLGKLFSSQEVQGSAFIGLLKEAPLVVSVGDRVTETLGELGRAPDLQIVDGLENRKSREPPAVRYESLIEVENPPGTLSEGVIEGVKAAFRKKGPVRVMVRGEEDLVAIPVIAFAPAFTMVFYGQPGEGIVAVRVDESSKSRNREIMARMGIENLASSGAS